MWYNKTKHRREVVEFAAGEFDFEIEYIADYQLRLTHPVTKRRLDFFSEIKQSDAGRNGKVFYNRRYRNLFGKGV